MNQELLKEMRQRIDGLDEGIIRLLNERAEVCLEVGRIKGQAGWDTCDPSREERIYQKLAKIQGGVLPGGALREIFREIISASRALQAPMGVSFLGPEASFSHQAALSHFGRDICIAPQATIAEVFAAVEKGESLRGVVPIENSTEGSVRATLDALITTPLAIRGEIFQRIHHSLLSASGNLAAIRKVYSHPQALAQCRKWLQANLPGAVLVETESTAGAAMRVKEEPSAAAVGSIIAAEVYRLKVLAEGIEDNPSNTTRFLIIGPQAKHSDGSMTGRDKTSLLFAAAHVPGGLQRALLPFAEAGINLTRIESFPMRDRLWEYLFFVDFVGHAQEPRVKECLEAMEQQTASLKVLGSYPRGIEPAESLQGKDRAEESNGNGNGKGNGKDGAK